MLNTSLLAFVLLLGNFVVQTSAFRFLNPYGEARAESEMQCKPEHGSDPKSLERRSPVPILDLFPRDGPSVTTPNVTASLGPVSAGVGNVNVSIGNVTVKAGNIEIENITIGNISIIVSVAFSGGGTAPASQTSFVNPATSISSSSSGPTSITSAATTQAAVTSLGVRQLDGTSLLPTITSLPTSIPSIPLPAPTVSGGSVSAGTGPIGASIGNITVSVGNINVSLGDITLKNVTIGNVFVLVQLGDSNNSNSSLVSGLLGAV